ncbi:MAG: alpha-amylase family glycosyl hydrolase [Erysipelotrichaceae bacterium]|nr:alpha-amylase family glycosyl hydrolase [Erysipelotrichaceae bacterium]
MSWYNETSFYHIYPLGLLNAPKENDYHTITHRVNDLYPWIDHIHTLGFSGLYIGPLFESVGHGYETTDYFKVDGRLGDNNDLKELVRYCHDKDIKVILDGVFNHTGRDFFAFKDILTYRENSIYRNWYNVNFYSNNSYNDGLSYENWGGYDLLVKLNLHNEDTVNYLLDAVSFWIKEFDIDGLRLDAADVLDFDFMKKLRRHTSNIKEDFWLMGEVIHGEYNRWVNGDTLHSVTNYQLHKAFYSGMNDHNFFEIAHTVNRFTGNNNLSLYNFLDNHDVERISSKLNNRNHYLPVSIMLYTLPGIPSMYYGSEFGIEGRKYRGGSDDEIRPSLNIEDYKNSLKDNPYTQIINTLGNFHKGNMILAYGSYKQLELQTGFYSYERCLDNEKIYVFLSNQDNSHKFYINEDKTYYGLISQKEYVPHDNTIEVDLEGNSGEILFIRDKDYSSYKIEKIETRKEEKEKEENHKDLNYSNPVNKSYEEMSVEELQQSILYKMSLNGEVTDQMKKTVYENVYRDSLLNWVKSFR